MNPLTYRRLLDEAFQAPTLETARARIAIATRALPDLEEALRSESHADSQYAHLTDGEDGEAVLAELEPVCEGRR